MKKIIGLLFLFLLMFGFVGAKRVEALVPCDYSACPYGCYTDGDCKPRPTSTPVPTSACRYGTCTSEGTSKCTSGTEYYCDGECWTNPDDCNCGCLGHYCKYPCSTTPSNTPVPTIAPTAVPTIACEGNSDGDNICNDGSSYCVNDCYGTGGIADIYCYTNAECANTGKYCHVTYNISVGEIYCPSGLSPTPTSYCHPFECYSAPNATYCPNFYPATTCASSGGVGNCDNCGGVDCGSCSGTVVATATPVPGGGTNSCSCSSYVSTASTLCSNQTFICPGSNPEVYCYGLMGCNAPTLESLTLQNSSGTEVLADSEGRNNTCENSFINDANSRRVILTVNVVDLDGYSNISTVQLRWNGNIYNMSFVSGSGTEAIYTRTIDFDTAMNNNGTYPFEINLTDIDGNTTGWMESGRYFKVWDCSVTVSGTLYNGSGGQVCNNTGFITAISSDVGFNSMIFSNTSGTDSINIAVNTPNYGTANLVWGQTYLPLVNGGDASSLDGDLAATGRFTRIIDEGVGTTSCPVNNAFNIGNYVSAYSTDPKAKVDLSYILDQEGWFQVAGAGVKAKSEVNSGVPVTVDSTSRALSISGISADNGLISYSTFTNINGYNDDSAYGIPNDWWIDRSTNDGAIYSYQYFYNNFLINAGIGMTGTDWNGKPSSGVYFVNGDLNIDSDFSLSSGETMIVVVKGKITIENTVNRIDGIYIADNGIEALGDSTNQLVINGMLFSRSNVRLGRSYTDKGLNNTSPPVLVNYQADLIFNMPGKLMRVLSGWREE